MNTVPIPLPDASSSRGGSGMIQKARYVHVNIISDGWEKLARFYESVFGCKRVLPERDMSGSWIENGTGVAGAHIRGAHLRLPGYGDDGPTLEIFQYDENIHGKRHEVNQTGISHIAFLVDNVEKALDEVIAGGGNLMGRIVSKQIEGVGLLTFVYAYDPDGNIIELQNWQISTRVDIS